MEKFPNYQKFKSSNDQNTSISYRLNTIALRKKAERFKTDSGIWLLTRKRGDVILDKQLLIFYIFRGVGCVWVLMSM